jgi:pilus assembly protein Flp/PilA
MIRYATNISTLFRVDRQAVTAIEYSLIASLIAVAIIAVISLVGGGISSTMTTVANAI